MLLIDQNLSPRLVRSLEHIFPGCKHARSVAAAADADIVLQKLAVDGGLILLTKDTDFIEISARNPRYKVIYLRLPNCKNSLVEKLLTENAEAIHRFQASAENIMILPK